MLHNECGTNYKSYWVRGLYSTRLFHEKFVNARDTPTNQSKHPSGQPFGFTAVRHVDCRATTDPAGPRRLTNTATRRSLVC